MTGYYVGNGLGTAKQVMSNSLMNWLASPENTGRQTMSTSQHIGFVQVLYGVPAGKEQDARALMENLNLGLRGVLGAIDAKCVPLTCHSPE
jgi:hypothetical protein